MTATDWVAYAIVALAWGVIVSGWAHEYVQGTRRSKQREQFLARAVPVLSRIVGRLVSPERLAVGIYNRAVQRGIDLDTLSGTLGLLGNCCVDEQDLLLFRKKVSTLFNMQEGEAKENLRAHYVFRNWLLSGCDT